MAAKNKNKIIILGLFGLILIAVISAYFGGFLSTGEKTFGGYVSPHYGVIKGELAGDSSVLYPAEKDKMVCENSCKTEFKEENFMSNMKYAKENVGTLCKNHNWWFKGVGLYVMEKNTEHILYCNEGFVSLKNCLNVDDVRKLDFGSNDDFSYKYFCYDALYTPKLKDVSNSLSSKLPKDIFSWNYRQCYVYDYSSTTNTGQKIGECKNFGKLYGQYQPKTATSILTNFFNILSGNIESVDKSGNNLLTSCPFPMWFGCIYPIKAGETYLYFESWDEIKDINKGLYVSKEGNTEFYCSPSNKKLFTYKRYNTESYWYYIPSTIVKSVECCNDGGCPLSYSCEIKTQKCTKTPSCYSDAQCQKDNARENGVPYKYTGSCLSGQCNYKKTRIGCISSSDCSSGGSCTSGECSYPQACNTNGICNSGESKANCPQDCECNTRDDCSAGKYCEYGKCVGEGGCQSNNECSAGYICQNKACIPNNIGVCKEDRDCPTNKSCNLKTEVCEEKSCKEWFCNLTNVILLILFTIVCLFIMSFVLKKYSFKI